MAAAQGSTAEGVVETEGLLPKTASPLTMTYLEVNFNSLWAPSL